MAQKVSVIIPNYNGEKLLSKNLSNVIKNCPDCEIIIVDDRSTDNSVNFVKKYKGVKLIVNQKNQGFAKSVNRGVQAAGGDLILLLNSDVLPQKNFLAKAREHFKSNDKNLFAVGLADQSYENNKIVVRGRGGAKFIKGFVSHYKLASKSGETLWVSGGSGLFDKSKFLALDGFDEFFAPFYWEDIDLSFRAWRAGFKCLFEPAAKVDHFHSQGAIRKRYSNFLIKIVSYKNQFLFVWKNIDDYFLIVKHIFWQPYHFAKALITLDFAFFAGFLWAVVKIPSLIFNYQSSQPSNYKLTEIEVLKKFERL